MALPVAAADAVIAEMPGRPAWEDIDELRGEIGVRAIGGGEEMDDDQSDDLQITRERLTGKTSTSRISIGH